MRRHSPPAPTPPAARSEASICTWTATPASRRRWRCTPLRTTAATSRGAKLADLRLSGPFDNDISTAEAWTGPVGLAPNTTYVVVVSETAGVQGDIYEVGATTSGGETTEEGGWSIGETLWQYNSRWGFWAVLDQRRLLRMSIVVGLQRRVPGPDTVRLERDHRLPGGPDLLLRDLELNPKHQRVRRVLRADRLRRRPRRDHSPHPILFGRGHLHRRCPHPQARRGIAAVLPPTRRRVHPKPIPRWDAHFGGLDDDRKDSTEPHITFGSQLGRHRQCGLAICTFHLGFSLGNHSGSWLQATVYDGHPSVTLHDATPRSTIIVKGVDKTYQWGGAKVYHQRGHWPV